MTASRLAFGQEKTGIAAASDLAFALDPILDSWNRTTRHALRATYGASGNFARQIDTGAPFGLFFSADESLVLELAKRGKLENAGIVYGIGRLVLFIPRGSSLMGNSWEDIGEALAAGRFTHLAIANPDHAPYGRAAREALMHEKLWENPAFHAKLVLGDSAIQTMQYTLRGQVDAALVPLALAQAPQTKDAGRYIMIPAGWHAPLRQRVALVKGAGPDVRAFYAYISEPAILRDLQAGGFDPPGQ
ncbi:MAG TPA: molybdate ABC transporter substrate-binding protein [Dongiaceae bacterium]|nr:molybdate ABC transporter substrate-binding protein [Dongiaceae bacterium]